MSLHTRSTRAVAKSAQAGRSPVNRRAGILGGTFDPIHCGHLDVGMVAQTTLALNEILVVPASLPPHRNPPTASGYHRFAMVALAIAGRNGWRALDLELRDQATSYTATSLRRLHADGLSAGELFFIVGADAFTEIESWNDYPALLDLANFVVVSRPGIAAAELPARLPALAARMREPGARHRSSHSTVIFLIDAATADVSSTAIRLARTQGRSIAGMVPPLVQQYIEQHSLYERAVPVPETVDHALKHAAGGLHGQK
ncbi:MAG: nicotinate (nicotinamide) nucleotide adenylyltransferase [Blastocatellia bacterium]|nr:MAG: nicotinate (nicotinamide) nucleotide adenylyltransferase [Blastocatellia bacterium]